MTGRGVPRRRSPVSRRAKIARDYKISLKLLDQLEYVRNAGPDGLAECGIAGQQRNSLLTRELVIYLAGPATRRRLGLTPAGQAIVDELAVRP
jgi:hypothetical protein